MPALRVVRRSLCWGRVQPQGPSVKQSRASMSAVDIHLPCLEVIPNALSYLGLDTSMHGKNLRAHLQSSSCVSFHRYCIYCGHFLMSSLCSHQPCNPSSHYQTAAFLFGVAFDACHTMQACFASNSLAFESSPGSSRLMRLWRTGFSKCMLCKTQARGDE